MGLLDKKRLLEKEELKREKVEFEGGDFVYVRQMSGRERDYWEQLITKKTKTSTGMVNIETTMEDFRAKLAVCTLCDESGKLLLTPADFAQLSDSMSSIKLYKIAEVAQRLNRVSEEAKEELVKNSAAGLDDSSSSGSAEK